VIRGPAIIMEMDSTTVVLPNHHGVVDALGNVLIYPDGFKKPKAKAKARAGATAKAGGAAKSKSQSRSSTSRS